MNKFKYIPQLSEGTQKAIRNDLIQTLTELNLNDIELSEALDDALNSRLCDLEDTININKYL